MSKQKEKFYIIQNNSFSLKGNYSFGDWQKVIRFIGDINMNEPLQVIEVLLDEKKVIPLLNTILTGAKPITEPLFEEEFEEVNKAINDFF